MASGLDRLKLGRQLFSEGVTDLRTLDHLSAAIHSREVHGPDLGFAFWMAGVCYRDLDKPEMQETALDAAVTLLPAEDDRAIEARSELATLYISQRRYRETEPHLRILLDIRRSHPYASDWLILLAVCVTDQSGLLTQAQVDEATSFAVEAYVLLTSDGPGEVITTAPFDRAVLQAMVVRARCWSLSDEMSTRLKALDAFSAADEFGRERIGPTISVADLIPLYEGWIWALGDMGFAEDAERIASHAARVTGQEVKSRNLRGP